jgi:hypothetical protein
VPPIATPSWLAIRSVLGFFANVLDGETTIRSVKALNRQIARLTRTIEVNAMHELNVSRYDSG